ncbi:TadE/TadG family type IV pilus assembly protein [Methylobacterium brachythecii]|uniref:Flp pilus assembly protein TadG n=1 Tax=Methylobacterium brachythecii TaxID=1176177 RepID=A0A7W6AL70_9HYPH|nr:TadE/TadG family type IV pilus assembly protein [Methylobacterium brachythecii]MBB3903224.1 Flp pilus assembly protein TadG [Methylobacterium brachythecii]
MLRFRRPQCLGFLRDQRAATAVEIALITPVFLILIFAWIEVGLCLFMLSTLDNAARDASRLIRVGTVTSDTFKAAICAKASPFIPCNNIVFYVQSGTSFGSLTPAKPSTTTTLSKTGFTPGGSGAEVLLQIGYNKPAFVSKLLQAAGFGGNIPLLTTLAFQSESY